MQIATLPPVSNRAGWSDNYELSDAETNEAIDLTDIEEVTLEVRDPDSRSAVLSATYTGGTITIADVTSGVFSWTFTAAQMRALCSKTYEVGCTIEFDDEEPEQLLIGRLPVLDGVIA